MNAPLIDNDRFFQALLEELDIPGAEVAASLDTDSFDRVPFITHFSTIAQDGNGPGLWTAMLTVTLFIEVTNTSFETVQALYSGIHAWSESRTGNASAVADVREIQAFTRTGQGAPMLNKVVTPYVGSFELTIRNI